MIICCFDGSQLYLWYKKKKKRFIRIGYFAWKETKTCLRHMYKHKIHSHFWNWSKGVFGNCSIGFSAGPSAILTEVFLSPPVKCQDIISFRLQPLPFRYFPFHKSSYSPNLLLYAENRHGWEWMYRSTSAWPRHCLEVRAQLHTPAALPPVKKPLVPIG
jgi:hypothetical protein